MTNRRSFINTPTLSFIRYFSASVNFFACIISSSRALRAISNICSSSFFLLWYSCTFSRASSYGIDGRHFEIASFWSENSNQNHVDVRYYCWSCYEVRNCQQDEIPVCYTKQISKFISNKQIEIWRITILYWTAFDSNQLTLEYLIMYLRRTYFTDRMILNMDPKISFECFICMLYFENSWLLLSTRLVKSSQIRPASSKINFWSKSCGWQVNFNRNTFLLCSSSSFCNLSFSRFSFSLSRTSWRRSSLSS